MTPRESIYGHVLVSRCCLSVVMTPREYKSVPHCGSCSFSERTHREQTTLRVCGRFSHPNNSFLRARMFGCFTRCQEVGSTRYMTLIMTLVHDLIIIKDNYDMIMMRSLSHNYDIIMRRSLSHNYEIVSHHYDILCDFFMCSKCRERVPRHILATEVSVN